jgi:hypothetical protein
MPHNRVFFLHIGRKENAPDVGNREIVRKRKFRLLDRRLNVISQIESIVYVDDSDRT